MRPNLPLMNILVLYSDFSIGMRFLIFYTFPLSLALITNEDIIFWISNLLQSLPYAPLT